MILFGISFLIISIVFLTKKRQARLKLEKFVENFLNMNKINLIDFNLTCQQKEIAIQNNVKIYYLDNDSNNLIPLVLNGKDLNFKQPTFLKSKNFKNYRNNNQTEPKIFKTVNTCFYFYPVRIENNLETFAFERKVLKFKDILKKRKKKTASPQHTI